MFTLVLALQAGSGGGLTWERVIAEIPHDAGAFVVYFLLGLMIFLTWFGSRKSVVERYSAPRSAKPSTVAGSDETDVELAGAVEPPSQHAAETLRPPSVDRSRSRKAGETGRAG